MNVRLSVHFGMLGLGGLHKLLMLIRMEGGSGVALNNCRRFFMVVNLYRRPGGLSEEGQLHSKSGEVVARWFHHFAGVLNVPSQFSQECVERMPSCEVRADLDDPPTEEEFENALSKMQLKKAGDSSRNVSIWWPSPPPGFAGFV